MFDAAPNHADRSLARIATPASKYWICKRAPMVALEAMEVLGGNGYIEETPLPRYYREAPVNSIWEGSGNVICLDVLRAVRREPAAVDALADELDIARGNRHLDRHAAALVDSLRAGIDDPARGRQLSQAIALALAAATLVRHAPAYIADAFCASRLATDVPFGGAAFGTPPAMSDAAAIVGRSISD
jgi:putative acyl-CoA dehydrogenase